MILNNHQKGSRRDNAILKLIEDHGAFNTEQVAVLFFSGSSRMRMAQRRLKRMYETKRIKRDREGAAEPYYYYFKRRSLHTKHVVDTNWAYTWFNAVKISKWEELWCYRREQPVGDMRPDAFVGLFNKFTKEIKFYFVEVDRSDNYFDKVAGYNEIYEKEQYTKCWWSEYAKTFPTIMVFTYSESRASIIQDLITRDNRHGLKFEVSLLDTIRKECLVC